MPAAWVGRVFHRQRGLPDIYAAVCVFEEPRHGADFQWTSAKRGWGGVGRPKKEGRLVLSQTLPLRNEREEKKSRRRIVLFPRPLYSREWETSGKPFWQQGTFSSSQRNLRSVVVEQLLSASSQSPSARWRSSSSILPFYANALFSGNDSLACLKGT